MAATVLTDMLVTVNGADLSGQSNKMEVSASVDELESTTFASSGYKEFVGGLASHEFTIEGLWAAGDDAQPDDRLWTDLGVTAAWTAAVAQATGSVAYFGNVLSGSHKIGGDIGTVAPFSAKGMGSGRAVRGELLHPASTARTSTGTSTGVELGALSATESMFCAVQVCSVAGTTPTLVVKLQSSATQGGSYTDRITFTSANSVSSQLSSVAGAVTDTWWRVSWTIGGTGGPSFLFAVAAGISTT
jgi:hypothetical protein